MLLYAFSLMSQDSTYTRKEGWPEVNLFYNFNDRWRLFAMYSATKLITSDYTDGATGIYIDYFASSSLREKFITPLKDSSKGYRLWVRLGYYYSTTPPESANRVKEHTVASESNSRFHCPMDILLTAKNRFDWRTVNSEFKVRYRPRVTFEKEMQTRYLYFTPYLYGEYFFNFNESSSDRFRLCFGFEVKLALYINFETYYLIQFRNGDTVNDVNAIGFALKFYLDRKALQKMLPKKKNK